jgi:LacI family transcriptional regulator
LADTVLATVYDAIELSANQAGYDTFVANTHDDPAEQLRRLSLLRGRSVDGLILGDARVDGANLATLAETGPPFVLVSRTCGDFLSVSADDHQGGWLVGQHLASLGHERIAVIGGNTWASTAIDRTQGCVDAVRAAGGDVLADAIVPGGGFGIEDGREATEKLLAQGPAPTAVFAVNDMAALGAMSCLQEHGLRIGTDVAVVGYNDVALASHLPVPLTTVRSPLKQMGEQAVALLLALLEGREPESIRLETELIVRASTTGVLD